MTDPPFGDTARRHILITGASSGLGAAMAERLSGPGVRLTLAARSREGLSATAATCSARGAVAHPVEIDVRDGEALEAALLAADAEEPFDLVIANAGLGGRASMAGALGEDPAMARAVAAVNFQGVVNTVVPLAPRLAGRGQGQIAIVSSLAALAPLPLAATYAASKAGITAYARSLRIFLRPKGVGVTLILPGFIETPMSRDLPGPKPGLWPVERAAEAALNGIARRKATVAFPLSLRLAAFAANLAPDSVIDMALKRWRAS
jgi:short-subunit dehydrogenase